LKKQQLYPMKHLTPKLILLAFTALVILASCEYEHPLIPAEPVDTTSNDTTNQTDTISFKDEIIPFFTSKCVICHSGSTAPDLRANKAYSALMNGNFVVAGEPESSILYIKCKPGASMASYTSSNELKLLKRWIVAGAKNN
jgi:hypothetical protein